MLSLRNNILIVAIPQGSILDPAFFLLQINDLPDDAFCIIATNGDDTTLFSKFNQASDLSQELEMASTFEFELRDAMDWGWKWFIDFNAKLVSYGSRCSRINQVKCVEDSL